MEHTDNGIFHAAALSDLIHGPFVNGNGHGHHQDHHTIRSDHFNHALHEAEAFRDIMRDVRFEAEHQRDAIHDVEVAVEKIGQAAELATEKTAAAINLAVEKTGAATTLAIEKTGAAQALAAAQNTSEIRRDLASCCCEIKELVREEHNRTRELVNSLELTRVRDDLADAKQELLVARLGRGPV